MVVSSVLSAVSHMLHQVSLTWQIYIDCPCSSPPSITPTPLSPTPPPNSQVTQTSVLPGHCTRLSNAQLKHYMSDSADQPSHPPTPAPHKIIRRPTPVPPRPSPTSRPCPRLCVSHKPPPSTRRSPTRGWTMVGCCSCWTL